MIEFSWTVDVGDLVIALVGLVLIPVARSLITTLSSIRASFQELSVAVFGTERDPSIGLVERIQRMERHMRVHEVVSPSVLERR